MQHPSKKNPPKPHRRKLVLILSVTVLAAAVAFVLLLPAIKARFPSVSYAPEYEPTAKALQNNDPSTLASLTVEPLNGQGYTLMYQAGALYLERNGELIDLNDSVSDQILDAATNILITDTVAEDEAEVQEHIGDMGLQPAQIVVKASYS
ncbi:MAG: hypothetical protein PHI98_11085, partial [Eubacteriales bacterium]|nr:hypothetical protein [Eubacteriales bacterium]